MAEEAIDYEAQYQARQEAFTRQRHADLLAAQRNAPAPANDAAPTPANDGEATDDPEQYYRERTQARLAARRSQQAELTSDASGSSSISMFGAASDEVRDMELLVRAVVEIAAIVPPLALFGSYNCRFLGGNFGLLSDQLHLINESLEQLVAPGKATLTGGGADAAGGIADTVGAATKALPAGGSKGGPAGSKPPSPRSGSNNQALRPLVIWQIALLFIIWALLAIGLICTIVTALFIPLLAMGVLGGACAALPSVCTTVLSTLMDLFRLITS